MASILEQFVQSRGGLVTQRGQLSEQERFLEGSNIRSMALRAIQAKNITDPVRRNQFIEESISEIDARKGDSRDSREALTLSFEEQDQAFDNVIELAQRAGVLEGIGGQEKLATKRAFEGDLIFRDDKGIIFSQQTFVDPNNEQVIPKLTDITGGGAVPFGKLTAISRTGESISEKRARDAENKADIARNIQEIKTSGAAEQEQEKKLGIERANIGKTIRSSATVARRSRSNILRLQRALKLVRTGRLAAARNLIGGLIPGIRDANAEVFQSLATTFALDELSRQSGTKTDFDFQKAAETQSRLGNTQEANDIIIQIALNRIDEIEAEETQFKEFIKGGGNAEDFAFELPSQLPEGVTEEDIIETMRVRNMTREQVLQRLGAQ